MKARIDFICMGLLAADGPGRGLLFRLFSDRVPAILCDGVHEEDLFLPRPWML